MWSLSNTLALLPVPHLQPYITTNHGYLYVSYTWCPFPILKCLFLLSIPGNSYAGIISSKKSSLLYSYPTLQLNFVLFLCLCFHSIPYLPLLWCELLQMVFLTVSPTRQQLLNVEVCVSSLDIVWVWYSPWLMVGAPLMFVTCRMQMRWMV